MRTFVYIDGFNLYYGSLKGSSYKWLDLEALCSNLLPHDAVGQVRYFTARVKPRPQNPDTAQRQQTYLRALATLPRVSVHYGHFLKSRTRMASVRPPPKTVEVWKTEEKGSDVNLATHLLIDGFNSRFERAVVISNDGDLKEPVEFVRSGLGLPVGVLNPHKKRSWALSPQQLPKDSFYSRIRVNKLAASQFPPTLVDGTGKFVKPRAW